jgi:hypothetical protein
LALDKQVNELQRPAETKTDDNLKGQSQTTRARDPKRKLSQQNSSVATARLNRNEGGRRVENTLRLKQAKRTMLRCPCRNAQAFISIQESIGASAYQWGASN